MLAERPRSVMAVTKRWLNEAGGSLDQARSNAALNASLASILTQEHRELLAATWARK
jgi:enoyl-CoA hydratase/carnithine racemase